MSYSSVILCYVLDAGTLMRPKQVENRVDLTLLESHSLFQNPLIKGRAEMPWEAVNLTDRSS